MDHPALVGIFHTVARTVLVTAAWYSRRIIGRGHSGGHRGRVRRHDRHSGAALARRQPQHRRSRYRVIPRH